MARNVTLSQLRTDVSAQCDFSTSVTGRYTPTLLTRIINQSIQRFRERISNEGMTHFLVSYSGNLTQGTTSTYAFQTLDLSALSPSLVRTYGVDITIAGVVKSLAHRPFTERNDFSVGLGSSMTGTPIAWAHFQTRSIAIMPGPDGDYPYTVWYLPVLADLSADGDTFDGVAGWEVWVLWDCVCQLIARDQYQAAYTQAIAERDLAWADIIRSSTKVSAAGGAVVGRDSFGQAGLWGGLKSRIVSAPAGGNTGGTPPLNSVTNAMLVNRVGPIVLGRFETTLGTVNDLAIPSLMPYMGVFAGAEPGLVPTGTGSTSHSLRGDGTWGTVAGSASGLGITQLAPIASPRVLGRITPGSGVVEELLGVSVGTMIGRFAGSGMRLVPHPTGGVQGKFLRDDGQWHVASPASLVPSGIQLPQLGDIQSPRVLGRFTAGSGVVEQLTGPQVASMVPLFDTTKAGLVPQPTGVTGLFLKDNGTWAAAGGGGSISNLPGGPTGSVQYNAGSGVFGGSSGFLWDGSALQRFGNLDMPTGAVRLGATGLPGGGLIRVGSFDGGGVDVITAQSTAGVDAQLIQWQTDGADILTTGRNVAVSKRWQRAATEHRWLVANVDKASLDPAQLSIKAGMRLGVPQLGMATGFGDKLGAWTASGFANVATGIHVVGSGMALAFGHAPAASGIIRLSAGAEINVLSGDGAVGRRVLGVGNTDLSFGDGVASGHTTYWDTSRGGEHVYRTGFVDRMKLSASGFVAQGNSPRFQAGASGGIVHGSGFTVGANNFGGKGMFMANTSRPSMAASGGGFQFVENGALMYFGQSGTITTLGPA